MQHVISSFVPVLLFLCCCCCCCRHVLVEALQSPGGNPPGGVGSTTSCAATTSSTTAVTTTATGVTPPIQVLVSGASGRTGQLVFSALLQDARFAPKALVRSPTSAKKLQKALPATGLDQILICDVTTLPGNDLKQSLPTVWEGCHAMVICTSAVPTISKVSLVKAFLKIPWNLIRGKKAIDFRSFQFVWQNQQYPELVDYYGQVAQIDLAKQLHIQHVVVVGSMGGTDPKNFLNNVGKRTNRDGTTTGNGDILLWKRKAEQYLVNSGLDYTIIHPGGLIDTPAGVEDYVLDVNDVLLNNTKRSISREDVANLCVAALALHQPGKTKIALDCITNAVATGDTVRTATEALSSFISAKKLYNYEEVK
jgi:NAD(P)H-binding